MDEPRKRQRRAGAAFACEEAASLPPKLAAADGPRSMSESDMWPDLLLESLERAGLLGNFEKAMAGGVHLTSDYSGLGTAEEAARCLAVALQSLQPAPPLLHGAKPRLCVQRAGDVEADCRAVLLDSSSRGGLGAPGCVHGDIGERCNAKLWQDIEHQLGRIKKSEVLKAELDPAAFAQECLRQVMRQDLRAAESFCYRHRKKCRVSPPWVAAGATLEASCAPGASPAGSQPCRQAAAAAAGDAAGQKAAGVPAEDAGGAAAMKTRMHVAGFNCYDWSMMGGRRGWFGRSTLPFVQWLAERLQFDEDIVLAENTPQFDVRTLADMTAEKFAIETFFLSPTLFGEPVERRRLYIVMLRKSARRWIPSLLQKEGQRRKLQRVFEDVFHRNIVMPLDEKFRAPQAEVQQYIRLLAEKNHLPATTRSGQPWSCYQAVSAATRRKIQGHRQVMEAKAGLDARSSGVAPEPRPRPQTEAEEAADEERQWTANLAQRPGYMGPVRGHVPAMLQGTQLWLFGKRRLALPPEHLEVQGWNVYGSGPYKPQLALEGLRESRVKSLAGNGMHLQAVAAVFAFALAATEEVPQQGEEWEVAAESWEAPPARARRRDGS